MPTAPLRAAGTAVVSLLTAGSATVPSDGMTPEQNVIVFILDDVGKEPIAAYDQTTWNPASPGSRVDPLTSWLANQWTELAQDSSSAGYAPQDFITELAADGMLLERMNVAAVCSPTRSSLMTGRNTRQHTLGDAIGAAYPADGDGTPFAFEGKTLFQLMDEQGSTYERIHIGKWHISQHPSTATTLAEATETFKKPVTQGYATFHSGFVINTGSVAVEGYSTEAGDHTEYIWSKYDVRENPVLMTGNAAGPFAGQTGLNFDGWWNTTSDDHSLVRCRDEAIAAIQKAASDDKPFFMNVWLYGCHKPISYEAMGFADLSNEGLHSYGSSDLDCKALQLKAFLEACAECMEDIEESMTSAQRAKTNIVFLSDNGSLREWTLADSTTDPLTGNDAVPVNGYPGNHVKRSPWQGGIGGACIINGPGVASPGNGTVPRVWSGLCGAEDLFDLFCHWTGTRHSGDARSDTSVLRQACANTEEDGRSVYIQQQFTNGYSATPYSQDQKNEVGYVGAFFISAQNAAGWKLLQVETSGAPNGEITWEWSLYDMTSDALEETDLFLASKTALGGTPTIQAIYNNLSSPQKTQFNALYRAIDAQGQIPPGMEVVLG